MPDVTQSTAPAISATSDAPVVVEAPEKAVTADSAVETHEESATSPGEKATADAPPKKPGGVQKRIDELTKQASEAEARYQQAMALIEKITGSREAPKEAREEDPEPDRSTYDDPDKYARDLAGWTGRRAAKAAIAEERQKGLQAAVIQAQQQILERFNTKKAEAIEKWPDWESAVGGDSMVCSVPMAQEIVLMEEGPAVAYYLYEHPAEAKRIAALDPRSVVREMARLEDKVREKAPVSQAPEPTKPLRARNASTSTEEPSMEEYAAQKEAKRRAEHEQQMQRTSRRGGAH